MKKSAPSRPECYLKKGPVLGRMMQRIHGSVAKLVNDTLPERRVPFWRDGASGDYFDGCIRDQKQCERAYNYTLRQSVRHRICRDWREYKHAKVNIELSRGLRRALELKCFLPAVPYKRYGERDRWKSQDRWLRKFRISRISTRRPSRGPRFRVAPTGSDRRRTW